ncbi:MAG TPA: hypothetical protein VKB64_05350 [Gaiellaceae bacterium]|nr:hypothetical protein [Gaiellaceae bacterium]
MRLTRRQMLAGAAAGALAAGGIYELVDQLGGETPKRAVPLDRPDEQHLLDSVSVVLDNNVEVVVPPRHHQLVTADIRAADLRAAQRELSDALDELDRRYDQTPAGLGVTLAYGLPYFERHVPEAWRIHAPQDVRAHKPALLPPRRFPSDPHDTLLEHNEVAVLLRSDTQKHIADAAQSLFTKLSLFDVTSIRRGFVGGGLPKKMSMVAGVPGADLVPEEAQLFLGFTSTQKDALGPGVIANHETLGFVDLGPKHYFRQGTHMHVSHLFEDLEAWYLNFDFDERAATAFRPGRAVRDGTLTVAQPVRHAASSRSVERDFRRQGRIGHSASIQASSRLQHDYVGDDGTVYPKGTAIPQRADFNTLDNPFAWSARADADAMQSGPRAGLHFVVFNPSGDDFDRNRLAMDGVLPDGTKLPLEARAREQGFNSILRTTHRQNFLVPPRRHRSFPLAEL